MHAVTNVTTESAADWLVAKNTAIQTGRHALRHGHAGDAGECDGRYVNTGFPPRHAKDFASPRLGRRARFRDTFDEIVPSTSPSNAGRLARRHSRDPLTSEIYGKAQCFVFLAEHLTPEEFFEGAGRGIAVGAVWSPEEAFENEHFVARLPR
jgi:hypothetical protein